MARKNAATDDAPAEKAPIEKSRARQTGLIFAILAALAVALGLKAWEEHQSENLALMATLQSEAKAVAAGFEGRANLVITAPQIAGADPEAASRLPAAILQVDSIVALTDAEKAPEGSRLALAAARAKDLIDSKREIGLTTEGDLVILLGQAPVRFALTPAGTWLPAQSRGSRLAISDGTLSLGAGDGAVADAAGRKELTSPGLRSATGFSKTTTACTNVHDGNIRICQTLLRPQVAISDLIRVLIFSLLVAAPVLAIIGLLRRPAELAPAPLIENNIDDDAERIMSLILRGARAGYWEWSDPSDGIFLSDGACTMLGLEGQGKVEIQMLLDQVHADHQARVLEMLDKARQTGWIQISFPTSFLHDRWLELRGSASPDAATGTPVFAGIVLDISERKQQEERVKAAERRLRAAIEGFDGPFALWDHRRRLLYWNRAFAIDFGLTDTLRAGMSHETVVIARAGAVQLEKQSSEDRRTTLIALQTGRWLKLVDRETRDGGLITVGVDVTENMRNEEELKKQRERMKKTALDLERSEGRMSELSRKYSEEKDKAEHAAHTKSAFLANMSHELRTPLNAINGFSEILSNELYGPLSDARYKGYAQDILTSGQHLLDMINDILDMAKIEAGKMTINPQPIDPVDPVDAAVRMIRRKAEDKQIALVLDAQPGLPDIEADHRAIRQMVLNLVSNAIKFTDAGGTITVRIEQRGPEIYVGVIDTGIGIPAEDLPRLSRPFEQVSGSKDRNTEGTGLGLALTKSFAEMHGGRMSMSSIYGEGTTVGFTLPIGRVSADMDDLSREVA